MNARQLLTVAVAATLLVGGLAGAAAAMPGDAQADDNTPDEANTPGNSGETPDQANDGSQNESADNSSDAERGPGAAPDDAGPPTDMPDAAPDKVTQIHETINAYLNGEVDNLGQALSDILGEENADQSADDESAEQSTSEDSDEQTTTSDSDEQTTSDSEQTTTTDDADGSA